MFSWLPLIFKLTNEMFVDATLCNFTIFLKMADLNFFAVEYFLFICVASDNGNRFCNEFLQQNGILFQHRTFLPPFGVSRWKITH